jgi:hypothetical protein
MIVKEPESKFTPVPPGPHAARCVALIDLGTQHDEMYDRSVRKVMLQWELPDLPLENSDKPMTIVNEYTQSLDPKAKLRKHLHGWRGRDFTADELKGFDLKNILGKPCLLSVIQDTSATGKVRSRVDAISSLPKTMPIAEQFHSTTYYQLSDGKNATFKALPEWIQKKISQCVEWSPTASAHEPENGNGHESDVDQGGPLPF